MIKSSDVKNQKLLDSHGRDILSFDDAWMTPPYDIRTMIDAYKAGMIGKAREVLDHIEENLDLFEIELGKMREIEALHGVGCLLDLQNKQVDWRAKNGLIDDTKLHNAKNYPFKCGDSESGVVD